MKERFTKTCFLELNLNCLSFAEDEPTNTNYNDYLFVIFAGPNSNAENFNSFLTVIKEFVMKIKVGGETNQVKKFWPKTIKREILHVEEK